MSFFGSKSRKAPWLPKLNPPAANSVKTFFFPMFWAARDADAVTQHVREASKEVAPGVHFSDNLFTWVRNNSMLDDGEFVSAWEKNIETESDRAIVWRRYILACAGYHCVHLDGDFVECGAYTGVGVKTVVDYLGGESFPRNFWLYDLFEHEEWMLHHAMPEHGLGLEEKVRKKFDRYPQVKIFKGAIPEVFDKQSPESIAYLHIDLNQPPQRSRRWMRSLTGWSRGGIVILDDYSGRGCIAFRSSRRTRGSKRANTESFPSRRGRVS